MIRDSQITVFDSELDSSLFKYRLKLDKIKNELGFGPKHSIEDAVQDLVTAFHTGKLPNSMDNPRYYNIKMMQQVNLS